MSKSMGGEKKLIITTLHLDSTLHFQQQVSGNYKNPEFRIRSNSVLRLRRSSVVNYFLKTFSITGSRRAKPTALSFAVRLSAISVCRNSPSEMYSFGQLLDLRVRQLSRTAWANAHPNLLSFWYLKISVVLSSVAWTLRLWGSCKSKR